MPKASPTTPTAPQERAAIRWLVERAVFRLGDGVGAGDAARCRRELYLGNRAALGGLHFNHHFAPFL